jgi:hypothetical protein
MVLVSAVVIALISGVFVASVVGVKPVAAGPTHQGSPNGLVE